MLLLYPVIKFLTHGHEVYFCNGRGGIVTWKRYRGGIPGKAPQGTRTACDYPKIRPLHQHRPRNAESV